MPQVYGDDDHKRTRRGSYYAIGKRLKAHNEFFESVWEVHAKCMAMFGPQVEETFLELHKARRGVEIAIEMLIRHLDDAPMTPDPNADLWQQLRADLCGAEGALSKEGDRIGRQLTEFRDGIEALCRPVLERGIGKKAT